MKKLSCHPSSVGPQREVFVSSKLENQFLVVHFIVKTETYNTSDKFVVDSYQNFGLWEFDVFEVFVQKCSGAYIELQVSPLNQWFALKIIKPRTQTEEIVDFGKTRVNGSLKNGAFQGEFIIDLAIIPGNGHWVYGNLCACLGSKDHRSFYALSLNEEKSPDFHRPDLFLNLDDIK